MNCPTLKQVSCGKGSKGKGFGSQGSKGKGKGKGKPSKGGRKGKLYEVSDESEDWWWYSDWNEYDYHVNEVSGWDQSEWYDGWQEWHEGWDDEPTQPENLKNLIIQWEAWF